MPFLFEALDDETELLLPDDLLTAHSVVHGFRTAISDEDCAEVEVLGWLYQFYIAERKDQVMARKSAVPSDDIPAVTQLFTPHWIVRYLVENSLGRLWLLNRPSSRLREHMPYYIEGEPETDFLKITRPEDIRLLDPACGSGHMLTYAFDLLVKIYEEEGHAPSEIPGMILRHNLYGLEICPRATQLAQFALVCKARENARAAFRNPVQPQVICLQDMVFDDDELQNFSSTVHCPLSTAHLKQLHQFRENTSTFGSLIQPILTADEITALKAKISDAAPSGDLLIQDTHRKICRVLDQAEMLLQRYHVVVANPPYMGKANMAGHLRRFAEKNYPAGKNDLYAMFIMRATTLVTPHSFFALVVMQGWLFLSKYEKLRGFISKENTLFQLLHLGPRAFDTISGEVVQATALIGTNVPKQDVACRFVDVTAGRNETEKSLSLQSHPKCYDVPLAAFDVIPTSPFSYWSTPAIRRAFEQLPDLGSLLSVKQGLATTEDGRFLRYWHEVSFLRICFSAIRSKRATWRYGKWFPFNKGGTFRKWYGNNEFVVNWSDDGREIKESIITKYPYLHGNPDYVAKNQNAYFCSGLTWSLITGGLPAFRSFSEGTIIGHKGPGIFADTAHLQNMGLALLNSYVGHTFLAALSPNLGIEIGHIAAVPLKKLEGFGLSLPEKLTANARADWDNFETSWDFRDFPLLRPGLKGATLEEAWSNWAAYCRANIARMQELETENNRLWIDAYGLQDELTPEVPEEQITLARPDPRKDIAAFLSYAVGCMMGRYSLDASGLILADAGDTLANYLAKLGKPIEQLRFVPDEDGILPILDGDWFEDDIVARTHQFLRATFGDATLEANLRFIEASLGKDLRKYFLTDFYKDHLQTYKKRPIYWLFQSPKKSFNALIYLHRYTRDTANRVLNRYLREYLHKLQARLDQLDHVLASGSTSARDKTQARKESDQLRKIRRECEEYERDILLPLAQQRLELDLDDGVKVNYLKLGNALAPIPGLAASSEE